MYNIDSHCCTFTADLSSIISNFPMQHQDQRSVCRHQRQKDKNSKAELYSVCRACQQVSYFRSHSRIQTQKCQSFCIPEAILCVWYSMKLSPVSGSLTNVPPAKRAAKKSQLNKQKQKCNPSLFWQFTTRDGVGGWQYKMFELAAEQGALLWTEQRAPVTKATKKKTGWHGVRQSEETEK